MKLNAASTSTSTSHSNNSTSTSTTHSHNTNCNNVTQNIVINAFGKEDISYITDHPNAQRFITKCLRNQAPGLCEFISKKHLNTAHPENQNIRKMNKKDEFMDIFDGKEWQIDAASRVVEKMLAHAEGDIKQILNASREQRNPADKSLTIAVNEFMEGTGSYLDWDLSIESDYDGESSDIDEDVSESEKRRIKKQMSRLLCEYVYRFSKTNSAIRQ
jgi:hypothetical protein